MEGAIAGANEMANNGLGTVVKRLGLGGVALCLKNPGCLALTGATGLELSRLANLAMEKSPGMGEDGAYAIAVADYLEEQVRGRPTTLPPVPNHTGNEKPVNPEPGDSSTTYPADGPKEVSPSGKPLDPQKPEDNILPGSPAKPLPGIGLVFNEGANGGAAITPTVIEPKIAQQMGARGWSTESIEATITNPAKTVVTKDTRFDPVSGSRLNDPATGYVAQDGSYVVRNDRTGQVVQVSDKKDPTWKAPWDK